MSLTPGKRLGPCRDWIAHDPDFDLIRDDPRFAALLSGANERPSSGF